MIGIRLSKWRSLLYWIGDEDPNQQQSDLVNIFLCRSNYDLTLEFIFFHGYTTTEWDMATNELHILLSVSTKF
jgi:hypothetical protein